jgi:serine protease AprX
MSSSVCIWLGFQFSQEKGSNNLKLSYDAGDYIGFTNLTQDSSLTGKNVTVAVMDTGIYANHSTFTDEGRNNYTKRILAFYDEDVEGTTEPPYDIQNHGTWAASILGGNSSTYQGVAPDVNFIIMKVFDYFDSNLESTVAIIEKAVDWIIQNKQTYDIKIASMSFGAKPEPDNQQELEVLNALAKRLVDNDILVVAAAGNYGPNSGTLTAPGSEEVVLCIGGVDYEGKMYSGSGNGPTHLGVIKPDVCAPAVSVLGAKSGTDPNALLTQDGTSAATPFVAGLAALMLEKKASLSSSELKSIISLTSYRTVEPKIIKDNKQGWGIIQAYAALKALDAPIEISSNSEITISLNSTYSVFSQPITLGLNHYFFELVPLDSAVAELYLFNSLPDAYGNPILVSHTINEIPIFETPKRLGIFSPSTGKYYLVAKLIHGTGEGKFLIRLVIEFILGIIIALAGLNILAMVYIGKLTFNYKKIRE